MSSVLCVSGSVYVSSSMMAIRMFTWTTINNNNNIDHLNIDQKFDNQQPQQQQQNHESLINFYLFKFILKWISSLIATKIATQQSPRICFSGHGLFISFINAMNFI
ncbi:hypothetical protein DERP_007015 [Dermatophagoides pteronyssinus]|uniref:Uncharacterized protein n=1 Tax=Dermatophagoides pteronyssinus TaxID=6956 RepID=A0ABQ8JUC8_DERPT|nr:hypothetical protein DERP_007015 [Dermatophagoides pteronyssinus]